ncbi:hypothetical protein M9Y10_037268 [Tritrichomonas musculus]|uniref:Glycosyltransferase 61 catalytic domain-containing protein n=1 Tax=Tritrichomonas musculus TaxID=1915356 RepID=A0ABR2GU87_9EUKA
MHKRIATFHTQFILLYVAFALILNLLRYKKPNLKPEKALREFRPKKIITDPLSQIPNWVPAPIPQYKAANYYPYIRINSLVSMCNESFNKSVPEDPTVITCIINAVVFKKGQIITSSFSWHHFWQYYDTKDQDSVNLTSLEIIDQAVYYFHPFHTCYFHLLIETFPLLLSFGKKILKDSVILHGRLLKKQFNELLSLFEVKFIRTLYVGLPVYVKKLYVTNPYFLDGCNPNALRHFRYLILKKCQIIDLPSTKNLIYNRKRSRFIKNFDVLVESLKSELPSYEFIIFPDKMNIVEQAKLWRSVRFAMMIHGSTLTNIIFMRPKTVVVEFARKDCRNSFVMLCRVLGIRIHVVLFNNQTKYFSMWVEPNIIIPAVRKIMEMLDKEKLTEI